MLMTTVRKKWMAAFLMAGFVAGYGKTAHLTYFEKHRRQ
jgi:hypothetical protein